MRVLGLVLLLLANLLPGLAQAVERYALVIGNSNYAGKPLQNPKNDAIDMATQLQKMGYIVHTGGPLLDLDRAGIEKNAVEFARTLPKDASALFYYAGHGMAVKNDNYLIPVNHQLEFQEQLPDRTVSLRSIIDLLKNSNPDGINVVLLDACRDNPLVRSFRSSRTGLQRLVDIPRGIFVGYAADGGQVAQDGYGRNGTYTAELLATMAEMPDVIVEIAHKEVAKRVYEKTNGKQFPVSENKIYGDWCFGACNAIVIETPTEPVTEVASQPRIEIKPKKNTWKIVGGVVLGLIVVGLLADGGDPTPPSGGFDVVVPVPE